MSRFVSCSKFFQLSSLVFPVLESRNSVSKSSQIQQILIIMATKYYFIHNSFEILNDNFIFFRKGPRSFLRFLALVSLVSVMLNTPKTFKYYPELKWATFIADCITLLGFTAEMVTKINHMGLYSNEKSYLKDKWCRFDARYVTSNI